MELGSVWKRLGADVTVIEFSDTLVPTMDKDIAKIFHSTLTKQGINFMLSTKVEGALNKKEKVQINCLNLLNNKSEILDFDKVLVAEENPLLWLRLREFKHKINKNGTIDVDKNFQTNIEGIYAIGDVISGPMLAHKASSEGHVFAEQLLGNKPEVNYQCIPAVVYTEPEVAWVGPSERELETKKIAYKKGIFPFSANARGKTTGDTIGSIKFLSDKDNDKVLAVHIIGITRES